MFDYMKQDCNNKNNCLCKEVIHDSENYLWTQLENIIPLDSNKWQAYC